MKITEDDYIDPPEPSDEELECIRIIRMAEKKETTLAAAVWNIAHILARTCSGYTFSGDHKNGKMTLTIYDEMEMYKNQRKEMK